MSLSAIIPAAGLGTRLIPLSLATPKELLPLGPKPVLQWIAEELCVAGVDSLVLVTSPEKPDLARLFREVPLPRRALDGVCDGAWSQGPFSGTPIDVAIQPRQLGLGHAVLCGQEMAGDGVVVVALGDCVFGHPAEENVTEKLLEVFDREHADAAIVFELVPRELVSRYGIAAPIGAGSPFVLKDLIEKPARDLAPSQLAIAARYVFKPVIFEHLSELQPGVGGELQLTDAIRALIQAGGKVCGWQSQRVRRFDIGNYASYLAAFRQFAEWFPASE